MNTDLKELQKIIKVSFGDESILLTAITHRSYLNENRDVTHGHNERLEFLGDAVLELVVTDYLYEKYGADRVARLDPPQRLLRAPRLGDRPPLHGFRDDCLKLAVVARHREALGVDTDGRGIEAGQRFE